LIDSYTFVDDGKTSALKPGAEFFRNGRLLRELGPPRRGDIEIRPPPPSARVDLVWTIKVTPPPFNLSFVDCITSRVIEFQLDAEATVDDLIEFFSGATGALFPPFALFIKDIPLNDRSVKLASLRSQTFSVSVPEGVSCEHVRVRHPVGDVTSEFIDPHQDIRTHLAERYGLGDPFMLARSGTVLSDADGFDPCTTAPVWLICPSQVD
jgi:hypothetical protein